MAGMPKLRGLTELIDSLGDEDTIMGRIANGDPLIVLAREYKTSRDTIYRWCIHTPERRLKYKEARRIGARAMIEESVTLADELPADPTTGQTQKVKLQAENRARLAAIQDPRLAKHNQPVERHTHKHLHIGELHLDALRKRAGPDQLNAGIEEAKVLGVLPASMSEAEVRELEELIG